MSVTPTDFPSFGAQSQTKLLVLGSLHSLPGRWIDRARSLNLEHVSPALMPQEISSSARVAAPSAATVSRRGSSREAEPVVAAMRRWFWMRKPDAGFVITDFPATLLQALVLDEWLDARDESLDAVIATDSAAPAEIVNHYRTLGLLLKPAVLPAA